MIPAQNRTSSQKESWHIFRNRSMYHCGRDWYRRHFLFHTTVGTLPKFCDVCGKDADGTGKTFGCKKVPLDMVNHSHRFLQKPADRANCKTSRSFLSTSRILAFVILKRRFWATTKASTTSLREAFQNGIYNVPGFLPNEQVRYKIPAVGDSDKIVYTALRPEQKSLGRLWKLIERFSQPGDIEVDPLGRIFSTEVAALTVANQRRYIGDEPDI